MEDDVFRQMERLYRQFCRRKGRRPAAVMIPAAWVRPYAVAYVQQLSLGGSHDEAAVRRIEAGIRAGFSLYKGLPLRIGRYLCVSA
jgi:hypothetical protein